MTVWVALGFCGAVWGDAAGKMLPHSKNSAGSFPPYGTKKAYAERRLGGEVEWGASGDALILIGPVILLATCALKLF
jgi:hypothetical protein